MNTMSDEKQGITPAPADRKYCQECGSLIFRKAEICPKCGCRQLDLYVSKPFQGASYQGPENLESALKLISQERLDPYYYDEFVKIAKSREVYKGKWNWAAFLFGGIWALTKGLTLAFVVWLVLALVTAGVAIPIMWFVYGSRGNYMFYRKVVREENPVF